MFQTLISYRVSHVAEKSHLCFVKVANDNKLSAAKESPIVTALILAGLKLQKNFSSLEIICVFGGYNIATLKLQTTSGRNFLLAVLSQLHVYWNSKNSDVDVAVSYLTLATFANRNLYQQLDRWYKISNDSPHEHKNLNTNHANLPAST